MATVAPSKVAAMPSSLAAFEELTMRSVLPQAADGDVTSVAAARGTLTSLTCSEILLGKGKGKVSKVMC